MPEREITPTRSAFLELKEERTGMQEGYSFLDEKRLILASEILAELGRYESEMERFRKAHARASEALRGAVARHGVEGLELYPVASIPCDELRVESRSVLGVAMHTPAWEMGDGMTAETAAYGSPEAEACRGAFTDAVLCSARLAVFSGNLERLRLEYSRTARRARALEDVLLPEIDDTLDVIDAELEELEREEGIRVRQVRRE